MTRREDGEPAAVAERTRQLGRATGESWDVVVVGGGIVGAGVLLDAVGRGLSAVLVEQGDIASGTSSRSSRLIHGGLRYLEQFRFGLVREALRERSRLLWLAPHLVRLEPVLFPFSGPPILARGFYGSGLLLYDLLGARHDGGPARHLAKRETLEWAPSLRAERVRGGIVYHDGVEDDARLALAVTRTALAGGGLAVTRVRATGVVEDAGRVAGVRVRDVIGGGEGVVRARHVIDATGVWAAVPDHPLGGPGTRVLPSRGAHILLPRERLRSRSGLTVRMDGRVLFLVPWLEHWIVGTTDAPDRGSPDRPAATAAEVDQLLRAVNRAFDAGVTRGDVVGTYAGLRPLIAPTHGGSTARVSREHRVTTERNGLVRVSGGKYTTYRVMARDAVDRVVAVDGRRTPSATDRIRLTGAQDRDGLDALAADLTGNGTALDSRVAGAIVARHGTEARDVVALGVAEGLLAPIAGTAAIEAEVVWAVRCELALSIDDVLARRLRLAQVQPDRGASIAPRLAELMGAELGWDEARRAQEVSDYLELAKREYGIPEAV
ncbi:MAG TPA: glycerol-3-phosphate dehydrogenase/oxidase [Candidatus Limnocylindrales bacterium]